jgi:hypothetical protein
VQQPFGEPLGHRLARVLPTQDLRAYAHTHTSRHTRTHICTHKHRRARARTHRHRHTRTHTHSAAARRRTHSTGVRRPSGGPVGTSVVERDLKQTQSIGRPSAVVPRVWTAPLAGVGSAHLAGVAGGLHARTQPHTQTHARRHALTRALGYERARTCGATTRAR